MAVTIPTTFAREYTSRVLMLSQQKESRFGSRVRVERVSSAELAYFDTIDEEDDPEQHAVRHGETPLGESKWGRRKVTPVRWDKGTLLDDNDVARMLHDPQGIVTQSFAAAFARKKDKLIRDAALGTAYIGKTGATSMAFEDESISINGDGTATALGTAAIPGVEVDITLAKVLLMLQIFNEADVDPDEPKYWAITPKSLNDLMNISEVKSSDYNTVKVLSSGQMNSYLGFEFFWTNLLTKDTTEVTCYRSIAWAQSGIVLAYIADMTTRISERDDRKYATQIYSAMDLGAVRMEGAKVHECLNKVA